jgi:hypothetical protein
MTILCSGCSFTIGSHKDENGHDVNYRHWPDFISRSRNVAVGGAGNRRIARTILENIDDGVEKMEAVVVMWSTVERYDFYDPQYKTYKAEGASFTGTKEKYLKYFYTDFSQFAKTLEYILLIQHMCKARNIPLVNCHMGDINYNDWDMDNAWGVGVDTLNLKARRSLALEERNTVKTFFEKCETEEEVDFVTKLWQQVNWDNWVYWKEKGGLWQYTNDTGYHWVAYHPPEQAHKEWAEKIIIPKLRSLNVKIR